MSADTQIPEDTQRDRNSMLALTDRIVRLHDLHCEYRGRTRSFRNASVSPLAEPGKPFRESFPPRANQGVPVDEAEFWLKVVAPTAYAAGYGDDEPEDRKTFMWSCRLLGLSWGDVHKAISDCRNFGFAVSAQVWAPYMRAVDMRYVGVVYTAFADSNRDVIKVGFSTQPQKRVKALSRLHGQRVLLYTTTPGTILHEWALHQLLPYSVASEWYRATAIPAWLTGDQQKEAA